MNKASILTDVLLQISMYINVCQREHQFQCMSVGVKYLDIIEDLDFCPTDFNEALPCRSLSVLLQKVEVLQMCKAALN